MDVYLAEKKEVAQALANCIDSNNTQKAGFFLCVNDVHVTWCVGHLLTLCDPQDFDESYKSWSLESLPMNWAVKYKENPNTQKQFNVVKKLLRQASTIYTATDIDAAGQNIADEIYEYLNIPQNKIQRILINDNNPTKLKKALHPSAIKPNANFIGLHHQEKGRAVADQRIGYQLTRLLSCQAQKQGLKKTLNVGRVQTAILSLVVHRQLQRENHIKQHYYNVDGEFNTNGGTLKARLDHSELHMCTHDDKGRITDEPQVKKLTEMLRGKSAVITQLESKNTSDSPPLPFDLLSLQVECSRIFGMSPDQVYDITQKLREAPYYAITYNRSDCRYLSQESFADAPEVISQLSQIPMLNPLTEATDTTIKSRAWNSSKVGAHTGIAPTGSITGWDTMPDEMKAVFLMIARNYLIQFLEKREREVTTYGFTMTDAHGAEYVFNGRTQRVLKSGWSSIFKNDSDNEETQLDDVASIDVSALSIGQTVSASITASRMETKPLAPYTMTTLLSDVKNTAKYIDGNYSAGSC